VPSGSGWVGCGDGFTAYPDRLGANVSRIVADLWPTAAAVARLAAPRLARGEGVDAGLATPLYVRDKVALTTAERLARAVRNDPCHEIRIHFIPTPHPIYPASCR